MSYPNLNNGNPMARVTRSSAINPLPIRVAHYLRSVVALAALLALSTARVPAATASPALSAQQTDELVGSYVHLTADFYKKVDRQAALDGARVSMIEYLKKHNVNAALPSLRGTIRLCQTVAKCSP